MTAECKTPHPPPPTATRRKSSILVGWWPAAGERVAIKAYGCCGGTGSGSKSAADAAARARRLAEREAVVLRHLNARGVPRVPALYSAYARGGGGGGGGGGAGNGANGGGAAELHLVQQWMPGGDALAMLQRRGGRGLPERAVAARFAAPLLRALAAVHAAGVVHRDVKLENVFLDADGRAHLGGESLACVLCLCVDWHRLSLSFLLLPVTCQCKALMATHTNTHPHNTHNTDVQTLTSPCLRTTRRRARRLER